MFTHIEHINKTITEMYLENFKNKYIENIKGKKGIFLTTPGKQRITKRYTQ